MKTCSYKHNYYRRKYTLGEFVSILIKEGWRKSTMGDDILYNPGNIYKSKDVSSGSYFLDYAIKLHIENKFREELQNEIL